MTRSNVFVALTSAACGAAIVMSLQACGQSGNSTNAAASDHQEHGGNAPTNAMPSQTPSAQLHAVMMRSMGDMKMSGDVDKDFASLMIPHHQGAIDMARIELQHGKNEELKKMAKDIIDSQAKEIETLKKHASMSH